MDSFNRVAHAAYDCKYHLEWCPKYRFRTLTGDVGRSVRDIIKQLCECKKIEILEGNVQKDHVYSVLSYLKTLNYNF